MVIYAARLINLTANGNKAMVTIPDDRGWMKGSKTRHLVRRPGGGWVGYNPNDMAKSMNTRAEAKVADTQERLAKATKAKEKADSTENVDPVIAEKVAADLVVAQHEAKIAAIYLAMVRAEFPLIVEYGF